MLWVYDSSLTDLNWENHPAMQELDIYSTPISSLRLHEKTPKLTWIRCQDTKLAQLNLSGAENLRMLLCSKNLLTSLGKNGSWTQESDGTLTVRASGPLDKFTGLQVDGKPVSPENYTAVSGSTVITLKKEFLKTLSAGTHKLTICFEDGACSTNLRIKPLGSPKTGESELRIWCSMLLTSCALMCCVALIAKKRCCSR